MKKSAKTLLVALILAALAALGWSEYKKKHIGDLLSDYALIIEQLSNGLIADIGFDAIDVPFWQNSFTVHRPRMNVEGREIVFERLEVRYDIGSSGGTLHPVSFDALLTAIPQPMHAIIEDVHMRMKAGNPAGISAALPAPVILATLPKDVPVKNAPRIIDELVGLLAAGRQGQQAMVEWHASLRHAQHTNNLEIQIGLREGRAGNVSMEFGLGGVQPEALLSIQHFWQKRKNIFLRKFHLRIQDHGWYRGFLEVAAKHQNSSVEELGKRIDSPESLVAMEQILQSFLAPRSAQHHNEFTDAASKELLAFFSSSKSSLIIRLDPSKPLYAEDMLQIWMKAMRNALSIDNLVLALGIGIEAE